MDINAQTRVNDLIEQYPFMLDWLLKRSDRFQPLASRVMRMTAGRVATLGRAAAMAGIPVEDLVKEVAARIRGEAPSAAGGAPAGDEGERRKAILKGIIKDIHRGEDVAALKKRLQEFIQDLSAHELAGVEQELISEGMPVPEVQRLCDVHAAVFKEGLAAQALPGVPEGHPVDTLMKENQRARELTAQIRSIMERIGTPAGPAGLAAHGAALAEVVRDLARINLHYARKENQLFPRLEQHGMSGPSQVMWGVHDEIRGRFKAVLGTIEEGTVEGLDAAVAGLLAAVEDMIYKEENILFPMALEALPEAEWRRVREGEEEIGYFWVTPPPWRTSDAGTAGARAAAGGAPTLALDTGHLSAEMVNLLLDRNDHDYASLPTQRAGGVLDNTAFGGNQTALPGPFSLPSKNNPFLKF